MEVLLLPPAFGLLLCAMEKLYSESEMVRKVFDRGAEMMGL